MANQLTHQVANPSAGGVFQVCVSGVFCRGGPWMLAFEKILVVCPQCLSVHHL